MTESLVARRAESLVEEAVADTRVIVLNGARQAGKSTLARQVARRHGGLWHSFDNPRTRSAAASDPIDFVRAEQMIVIDEVQRLPDILLPIKLQVDEHPRPGSFLLTGSARVMGMKNVADTLPGRVETIELWPFSQGEIDGSADDFVDHVLTDPLSLRPASALTKHDYVERICRGGFPDAVSRTERRRSVFLRNYVADLVNREVKQVSEVQRGPEMRTLIQLLAGQVGGLLVPANLAQTTGLSKTTVSKYLAVLHEVFLIKIIPAWSRGATGRAVKAPKFAFVDSGVAAQLSGHDSRSLVRADTLFGGLLESFVAMELARQTSWSQVDAELFHYRTRDGVEVDIVLQDRRGNIVGVEVKASSTAVSSDFSGLRHLAARLGSDFLAGIVLYTGPETLSFGPNLRAMPISAVWDSQVAQE
ncbi:MAG: ATP-binding protein [Micrococcales bacterium]|nr:ATP-binding protein [Micrococcales bacterium]